MPAAAEGRRSISTLRDHVSIATRQVSSERGDSWLGQCFVKGSGVEVTAAAAVVMVNFEGKHQ